LAFSGTERGTTILPDTFIAELMKQIVASLIPFVSSALLAGCATSSSTLPRELNRPPIVYTVPPLPYEYSALEPAIDTETMKLHHDKHHQAYVDNVNKALANTELASIPLEELFATASTLPPAVRNNGGGHYNHSLFWQVMGSPKRATAPSPELLRAINNAFGSLEALKEKMSAAGTTRFGSGWAWLVKTDKGLAVSSTPNQDNPLMDTTEVKGTPILALDVWEHAYYLKYKNKRADYVKAWWSVVNWDEVSRRYSE
jgi:Fe-Mn family superoxide dismutase